MTDRELWVQIAVAAICRGLIEFAPTGLSREAFLIADEALKLAGESDV